MIRKICQFVVLLVVSPLVLFSLGLCLAWAVTITPTMDGRKRPGRVYAFSCNEARTLFRELYLALCGPPPE